MAFGIGWVLGLACGIAAVLFWPKVKAWFTGEEAKIKAKL